MADADRFNVSALVLRHRGLAWFFLALLAVGGAQAYFQLGQREDPDFVFRAMVIRTFWPGATAEEVDRQVTERLVKRIEETPWYRTTTAYSKPGESLIILELQDTAPGPQVPDLWYQVRKKVGDLKSELPAEVQGPYFNDEFGDVYGTILAFRGQDFSLAELRDLAEQTRLALVKLVDVAKVELIGVQPERVTVEIPAQSLASLGLSPQGLAAALQGANSLVFAGTLETPGNSLSLRVSGSITDLDVLRQQPLTLHGRTLRLGDIAQISRGYLDPPVTTLRYGGQPAVGVAIAMKSNGDVLRLGREQQAVIDRIRAELPLGIEVAQVSNQPAIVRDSVGEFMMSLLEAVAIVLLVSFLSLGWRPGLVVAVTIPLVLGGTFLLMRWFDIDLHRISTGALIVALGLLVDDAMIAVEMMARKLEEGWDRLRAAAFAYESTAFPMLTGTLITAAGFLPIATAKSTTGEYTFALFAVTSLALLASWGAAVVITPLLGALILKPHHPEGEVHELYDTPFYRRFRRLVELCIHYRKTVLLITLGLFAAGVLGMGLTEKQFFPSSNRTELLVDLWLAEGSGIQATGHQVGRLEDILGQDPDVATFVTYLGNGSPRFFLSLDQQLFRTNFSQTVVLTRDLAARERVVARLRDRLENEFPGVRGRLMRIPLGPPVTYPVQFRVIGPDTSQIKRYAEQVAAILRDSPLTRDIHLDWGDRAPALRLMVDQDKAAALGLTETQVRQTLYGFLSGLPLTTFRERDQLIPVLLRAPAGERERMDGLEQLPVGLPGGGTVPLSQVADNSLIMEEPILWRRNREPTLTVRADIVDGVQAPDVAASFFGRLEQLSQAWPPGYRIETGGAYEENQKAERSIQEGFPAVIALIAALLMLQLQRLSATLMVMITAPLGLTGVAAALLLFQQPFGFVAMLGTIALSGMIMRNTLILVDQIRQEQAEGQPLAIAIREATVRRLRPIALTAAAAMLAMIPLTRSILWGPMAFAIMGGLLVATLLTLLFTPALYAVWFGVRDNPPKPGTPG